MSEIFSDAEREEIQNTKDVMRLLAQVIRDRDVREVVKDPELAAEIGEMSLEEALADENLGTQIRRKTTPDMPLLNAEQEALLICQLGPSVYGRLFKPQSDDDDNG